ncbi:hypothetical protein AB1Y20_016781 [Prymnesium parvum]|uniref:F-box domain-containing protein n=1 Tax=Prymnesium parvum TaxID=97485 RepID=A0AB34IC27_PRYPA
MDLHRLPCELLERIGVQLDLPTLLQLLSLSPTFLDSPSLWKLAFAARFLPPPPAASSPLPSAPPPPLPLPYELAQPLLRRADALRPPHTSWRARFLALSRLGFRVASRAAPPPPLSPPPRDGPAVEWGDAAFSPGLPLARGHTLGEPRLARSGAALLPLLSALRAAAASRRRTATCDAEGGAAGLRFVARRGTAAFDTVRLRLTRRARGRVECVVVLRQSAAWVEQAVEEPRVRTRTVRVLEVDPRLIAECACYTSTGSRLLLRKPTRDRSAIEMRALSDRAVAAGEVARSRLVFEKWSEAVTSTRLVPTEEVQPRAMVVGRCDLHELLLAVLLQIDRFLGMAAPPAASRDCREAALLAMGFAPAVVSQATAALPEAAAVGSLAEWIVQHSSGAEGVGDAACLQALSEATLELCDAVGYQPTAPGWAAWRQCQRDGYCLHQDPIDPQPALSVREDMQEDGPPTPLPLLSHTQRKKADRLKRKAEQARRMLAAAPEAPVITRASSSDSTESSSPVRAGATGRASFPHAGLLIG